MKQVLLITAGIMLCMAAYAAMTTDLSRRQTEDPRVLRELLEANFSDAETRVAALEVSLGTNVPNEAVVILGLTVTDGLGVGTNATVGGTLGVTGVATFTAESVHNLGIDADYITTDAGAGIDTKTAGTLAVGAATATKVEISDTGVGIEAQGPLTAKEDILSDELDTETATALLLGKATATGVTVGAADAHTTIAGNLLASEVDAATAEAMNVGKATATELNLGASDITTTVKGPLVIDGDTAKLWLGTNGYFQVTGTALEFVGFNDFTNAVDANITE